MVASQAPLHTLVVVLDVLIVTGINDLMESKSPFQLMCNFAMIAEALEWNAPASRMQHFICRQRSADWPATTPGAPALFCDLTNEIKELNTHIIE